MCQIASYGFSRGTGPINSTTCNGTTNETFTVDVSMVIATDGSDTGKTFFAECDLQNVNTGIVYTPKSSSWYVNSSMHTFNIPLTGLMSNPGTYNILSARISTSSVTGDCFSFSSTRCTSLTLTSPCNTPTCGFTIA